VDDLVSLLLSFIALVQLPYTRNSELDHTTIYNYQNYAASEFGQIALLGALMTAGTIISAVLKPPIARISDVVGRAETYVAVVIFYIISYVLCASAKSFARYAGGYVIYCIGQTGMQILNQVIVADITSSRCRGLANGLVNLPFMIIPWASAFIVDSALANIGWRWGEFSISGAFFWSQHSPFGVQQHPYFQSYNGHFIVQAQIERLN